MKKLVFVIVLIASFGSHAQEGGFYGKKNVIEFNTGLSIPLFNILGLRYENYMKTQGGRLKNGNNYLDFAFRGSYMHATKSDFGIGFEYSNIHRNIPGATYYNDTTGHYLVFEKLGTTTHLFMPKLEFCVDNGLLPVGLSHQIGVGFGRTTINERESSYGELTQSSYVSKGSSIPIVGTVDNAANFDLVVKSLTILYEMHVKVPVSKRMTINYGFRYNANINLDVDYNNHNSSSFFLSNSTASRSIRKSNFRSAISFNIGVGYIF